MDILLGFVLLSWFITSILFIPYIKLLYRWKFQRAHQQTRDAFNNLTPIFDKFHSNKAGIPVGGGLLVIAVTSMLFPIMLLLLRYFWFPVTSVYPLFHEVKILITTFISFGILGLIDDIKKTFVWANTGFFGLRLRHKLLIEILIASVISIWLVYDLKIGIFNIPFFGVIHMGIWFIPFAVLVIIAFANAYNITDGLDGLSTGILMIALTAFWIISASILDTPLSVFIAVWLGSIVAYLYFNVYPARILLGDVGALSFGATFAVVGLMLGKAPVLLVIGGIYVIEVLSSFLQLMSKKYLHKKIMAVAPLHLWLQNRGWPEPKIVMRFWLLSIIFSVFGLWIAFMTKTRPY